MGERFMLPTTNLSAGRAMLRHYCEGGTMIDQIGQYIIEMANTVEAGKKFLRRVVETDQINETTEEIVDIVKNYVLETNSMMKRLVSGKSYNYFKENFKENREFDTNTRWLENMFTKSDLDDQLGQVLPEVNKIIFYNEA
jgi:predicted nuclease with TOPRIM domain